jgi:hypothetical protein
VNTEEREFRIRPNFSTATVKMIIPVEYRQVVVRNNNDE